MDEATRKAAMELLSTDLKNLPWEIAAKKGERAENLLVGHFNNKKHFSGPEN